MAISFNDSVGVWWSYTWRFVVIFLPIFIGGSFLLGLLAVKTRVPALVLDFLALDLRLLWCPVSLIAVRGAITANFGLIGIVNEKITWGTTIAVWLGYLWRSMLYAVLPGVILILFVPVGEGGVAHDPRFALLASLLCLGPVTLFSLRAAMEKQFE